MSEIRVRIGNIPNDTTDEQLIAFLKANSVTAPAGLAIAKRRSNNTSLGFAVAVCTEEEETSLLTLNKKELGGRALRVARMKETRAKDRVFVRSLPSAATQETTIEKFKQFGVVAAEVVKFYAIKNVELNRGTAALLFANEEDAKAAVDAIKKEKIGERDLHAFTPKMNVNSVRVVNIPFTLTKEAFDTEVKKWNLKQTSATLYFPHASIELLFKSDADAAKAIEVIKDKQWDDSTLRAELALLEPRQRRGRRTARKTEGAGTEKPKREQRERKEGERQRKPQIQRNPSDVTIQVDGLPKIVQATDLETIFEGTNFTKVHLDNGIGYATFANAALANKAFDMCHLTMVEGKEIKLKVLQSARRVGGRARRGRPFGRRGGRDGRDRGEQSERRRDRGERVVSETAVYVASLSFNAESSDLEKAFAKFNADSARVMRSFDGRSRGYGFVYFKNAEDAKSALDNNGTEICGRKIIVSAAYTK